VNAGVSPKFAIRGAVCALLFALSLGRYWIGYDPSRIVPQRPEGFKLAHNIAADGQFANPFSTLNTGPSAHLAPAFPFFLAVLIKALGAGAAGAYAFKISAVLTLALLLALFPLISEVLGLGLLNGAIAALLWLVVKVPESPYWEGIYASLLVALAICCYRKYLETSTPDIRLTALLGCVMGMLILLIPSCMPVLAGYVVFALWKHQRAFIQPRHLILVIAPALIVLPWIIRNYVVFDRIVPVRDNLGLELSVSNSDCAAFSLEANIQSGCFMVSHPDASLAQAYKVLAMGEASYNHDRLRQAWQWIGENPGSFGTLCLERMLAFWIPDDSNPIGHLLQPGWRSGRLILDLTTGLSVIGLFIAFRRDGKTAAIFALWLCLFPLVYYVVQFDSRYRLPVMALTFLLGALPISALIAKMDLG